MKANKALLTLSLIAFLLNLSCGFGGYKIHLGTFQEAYAARLALNPLKTCSPLMFQDVWTTLKKDYIKRKTDKELWQYSLQGLQATTKKEIPLNMPPSPGPMSFWLLQLAPASVLTNQPYEKLCYAAINGMVKGLNDKYTAFYPPAKALEKMKRLLGSSDYVGLGFTMMVDFPKKQIFVEDTQPDSPARGVFKRFDEIIAVNGVLLNKLPWKRGVSAFFQGKEGTKVVIIFKRGKRLLKKTFTRKKITYKNAQCNLIGEIAYCKIMQFRRDTVKDFIEAFEALPEHKKKIIVDFRGNGGGLIYSATNLMSRLWLKDKISVIIVKRKYGAVGHADGTSKEALLEGYKTIALQDKRSASATEMVLAALRDYSSATLMGEKSFGKGIAQSTKILYGAVLTWTCWYFISPYGHWIHEIGVEPHVKMSVTMKDYIDKKDPLLKAAIKRLK